MLIRILLASEIFQAHRPILCRYGMVLGRDDLTVERLSEEHAVITAPKTTGLTIGSMIIIPAHACTTVNLHPALLLVPPSGNPRWLAIDARGWQ
jgi:D-serine deaminase-like pyridoxal phosphate-dependent protein